MKAKTGSNVVKALIVVFLFCEYHLQSMSQGSPLSADSCQGLLFIAIAGCRFFNFITCGRVYIYKELF